MAGYPDSISIGFTYSNLEAVLQNIESSCIEKKMFSDNGIRTAWLRDPDGRLIQLFEQYQED